MIPTLRNLCKNHITIHIMALIQLILHAIEGIGLIIDGVGVSLFVLGQLIQYYQTPPSFVSLWITNTNHKAIIKHLLL